VALTRDLAVDSAGTEQTRQQRRQERLRRAGPARPQTAPATRWLGANLERVAEDGRGSLRCRRCGHRVCREDEDPREHAAQLRAPLAEAGPWLAVRWAGHSPNFELVLSACPACGVLLDVEERRTTAEGAGGGNTA
jgi:hypothetical protein